MHASRWLSEEQRYETAETSGEWRRLAVLGMRVVGIVVVGAGGTTHEVTKNTKNRLVMLLVPDCDARGRDGGGNVRFKVKRTTTPSRNTPNSGEGHSRWAEGGRSEGGPRESSPRRCLTRGTRVTVGTGYLGKQWIRATLMMRSTVEIAVDHVGKPS